MKLLLIIWTSLLIALLVIGTASAENLNTKSYTQGDYIDLKISCEFENATTGSKYHCGASALCNITVLHPNGSVWQQSKAMTNNGVYHNYTLGTVNKLGNYQTLTSCCKDSYCSLGYSSFEIMTGKWYISPMVLLLSIICIAALSLLISYMLSDEHLLIKSLLLVYGIFYVIVMIPAALINPTVSTNVFKYSSIIWLLIIGYIIFYVMWFGMSKLLSKFQKGGNQDNEFT